jgi:hypothetical protein
VAPHDDRVPQRPDQIVALLHGPEVLIPVAMAISSISSALCGAIVSLPENMLSHFHSTSVIYYI